MAYSKSPSGSTTIQFVTSIPVPLQRLANDLSKQDEFVKLVERYHAKELQEFSKHSIKLSLALAAPCLRHYWIEEINQINKQHEKPIIYTHSSLNPFFQVKAYYAYQKALAIRNNNSIFFSSRELSQLKIAANFGSFNAFRDLMNYYLTQLMTNQTDFNSTDCYLLLLQYIKWNKIPGHLLASEFCLLMALNSTEEIANNAAKILMLKHLYLAKLNAEQIPNPERMVTNFKNAYFGLSTLSEAFDQNFATAMLTDIEFTTFDELIRQISLNLEITETEKSQALQLAKGEFFAITELPNVNPIKRPKLSCAS